MSRGVGTVTRLVAATIALPALIAATAVLATDKAKNATPPPTPINAHPQGTGQPATTPPPRTLDALIATLEAEARKAGVQAATVRRVLAGLERDPEVAELAAAQTEHERTTSQYLALLVTQERVEVGRQRLVEHATTLRQIEARYGVDAHVLTALWGIETRYGAAIGSRQVIRALATLAMEDERRPEFWRIELLQALRIVERGDIAAEALLGSWAGAIGHTQFMPSTFNLFAVDFDGDGKRDLLGSIPDALASAANYLANSGWRRGETWGFEVTLPDGFDFALAAPTAPAPLSSWAARGVTLAGGAALPASALDHRILLPAGANGPAFLVSGNFSALLRYNPAVSYALAVAHLGDRIGGRVPFVAAWPDEPAMSRVERRELQERLSTLGLDTGGVDGIIGSLTRNAIRSYQKTQSLPEDGHPSSNLLERLRAQR